MDKTSKALKKLSSKERRLVQEILEKIDKGDFHGLNLKKLKGNKDIFRARKGDMRIIFQKKEEDILVLAIERKSKDTYKRF